MEAIKKFINEILAKAAIIYLLLTVFITALYEFGDLEGSIKIGALLLIFVFSLAVSWGLKLFEYKSLSFPLALLLHYGITVISGYVVFSIVGRVGHEKGMILIISICYAVPALIAMTIRRLIKSTDSKPEPKKTNHKNKNQPYKKQFK